jgi:transposase
MSTRQRRKMTAEAQEELRFLVVRAIREQGLSQAEACRTFGVGKTSVWRWLKAIRSGGEQRLKSRPRGRPKSSSLRGHQAAMVVRLITDRCPDQLKLPFALWTRAAVQQLIAERFGLRLSLGTVGRYLQRWGFTPQKPLRRAYEQDRQAVEHWRQTEYPAIAARAKREQAVIHWGDEMGLRSDHQTGTSFSPRGQTPVIPGTGQRFRCNTISTITNQGQLAFMVFRGPFTARVLLKFLKRLVRQLRRAAVEHPDADRVEREVSFWR